MSSEAAPVRSSSRARLSPEKGSELVGLLSLTAGLLLLASFVSYSPQDPSFLHDPAVGQGSSVPVANWIGRAGAQVAALGYGFLGFVSWYPVVGLLMLAARQLRRREPASVTGRRLGLGLLAVSLPALLHLTVGSVIWRGEAIDSGGAFGRLLGDFLAQRLALVGALLVVVAVVAIGAGLTVQTTLGDLLREWRQRLARRIEEWRLSRTRDAERREKENARARVVEKHLAKLQTTREPSGSPGSGVASGSGAGGASRASGADPLDLPLRGANVPRRASTTEEPDWSPEAPAAAGASRSARAPRSTVRRGEAAGSSAAAAAPAQLPLAADAPSSSALPPINLLQTDAHRGEVDENELVRLGEMIRTRCVEFGVEGTIEGISPGPIITVYEFQPAPGVKVSQIVNLQDDLALSLRAESIRIDRMAGRSTLGIEVPNRERAVIRLGHLLSQDSFRKAASPLTMAIGTTIHGEPYYADLATMPHLLVAGATGSGKSVGLQAMITSILYRATREQVQFIFIDPKRIELGVYADIPHLKAEVVVEPKKAANALRWAVAEMERRYRLLAEVHARSIDFYNRAIRDPQVRERLAVSDDAAAIRAEDLQPLPYYVVIIDELADLMMVASAEVETSIARLAQMARAVGIHLIVATQRPSVDVLTGTIKANFPCRMAFATASRHDSRTILDQIGSEKLLGRGDMLFMPQGSARLMRLHGAYVSEQETASLVRWLKRQGKPQLDPRVVQAPETDRHATDGGDNDDELFDEAARLVVAERQASASFLQRRMRVGFSRAARLIDMMEREGLLGPAQGSKPRDVLVPRDYFEEVDSTRPD